jgi:hypothetical protein
MKNRKGSPPGKNPILEEAANEILLGAARTIQSHCEKLHELSKLNPEIRCHNSCIFYQRYGHDCCFAPADIVGYESGINPTCWDMEGLGKENTWTQPR